MSKINTKTCIRFAKAVEDNGGPMAVAYQLGVTRSTIDYLVKGERVPGLGLACDIEALYRIRPQDWLEPITVESVNVKRVAP